MKSAKILASLVSAFVLSMPASAAVITSGGTSLVNNGLISSVAGSTTVDFTSGTLIASNYTEDGATYAGLVSGSITNTSTANVCAQPPSDTSNYLCVGPGRSTPVNATFSSLLNYFGFYVGSVDTYNSLNFYDGNTLKFSLTGSEIATRAGIPSNGNQSIGVYINIFASNVSEQFNRVELVSTGDALESDNHAFGLVREVPTADSGIPEPGTLLTIIPAVAFFYFRRKR